ncbi:hypothetical protein K491DRAFT_610296 [Lophiostoma macrostomum CBS 122681]|uniref:C3H1-type domain-containing protein n=1 Tax=Lophiostoma macrostomum CBS 122681 TaxID=1314788 RepID=A0A6A6SP79_9PLEO|nr:hypothetical protein K491DRAFT_610296 [Lophiostoma macrostomum CBS 122681]
MAPSHVPDDPLSLQGQDIYNHPHYANLFSRSNQYGTPSWDQFNQTHSALLPQGSDTQSWHQNPQPVPQQPYTSLGSPYGNTNQSYQTASPFQYSQYNNHGPLSNYGHQSPAVDPALIRQQQQSPYQQVVRNSTPQGQPTVTPQALQQNGASLPNGRSTSSPFQIPKSTTEMFAQRPNPQIAAVQPVTNPKYEIPKGKKSGGYSVIDQAALANATKSTPLNKLINLGTEPLHLAVNRTALPTYTARQSVKEVKKAGSDNRKFLDKHVKKSSSRKFLLQKSSAGGRLALGSPSSLKREISDSESSSESSDESETSDDDLEVDEPSPLPASRPDEPHAAVRYDVIKASWYPRNSLPGKEKVQESLRSLWEVLNTIQKRWRADSRAVTEAEEQKKMGELPVLKSRVTGQRDLLQSALRSLLDFGHPDVVYQLGLIKQWLYLCYQFLANRYKVKDYDGGLSTVIYEALARGAGTLSNELLDETKLMKALVQMKKNANERNKTLIQQIIDGAAARSRKAKAEITDAKIANAKRPMNQSAGGTPSEGPAVKKMKAPESAPSPVKKAAVFTPGSKAPTTATTASQKRPGERSAMPAVKARQVVNKPSSFFSTLNAASKKPTPAAASATSKSSAPQKPVTPAVKDKKPVSTAKPSFSFADTMAQLLKPTEDAAPTPKPEKQLPPETAEEKAKRLRKESRRHLRVTFRPDASLVSIRYFSHDPEEELGHEANFVRDAGDIGGEGRMFKQHRDMVEEEDDDEEMEVELRAWNDPSSVDFIVVDAAERERNYEPYGGGERKPDCPEKQANQQRENSTLMVFYSHPSDIPSTPREPADMADEQQPPSKEFGAPPQFIIDRLPKSANPTPVADFSSLESVFRQYAQPPTAPTPAPVPAPAPAPAPAAPTVDLASILSALSSQQAQAPALAPIPPPPSAVPGLDLSSLLSIMQQNNPGGASAPPNWPQFPQMFAPQQQAPAVMMQPQAPHNPQQNGNSKRQRDDGSNERGHGSSKRQRGGRNAHHSSHNPHNRDENRDRPHKVVPCKFFAEGKCTKGDDCTFIHDRN